LSYAFVWLLTVFSYLCTMDLELKSQLQTHVYDIVGCCLNVRKVLGPYLNEYMYQEALEMEFQDQHMEYVREYQFTVDYKGRQIKHRHFVDFLVKGNILVECKAIESLGNEQRQQLWNYMRLTKIKVGILFNFAPFSAKFERYYMPTPDSTPIAF